MLGYGATAKTEGVPLTREVVVAADIVLDNDVVVVLIVVLVKELVGVVLDDAVLAVGDLDICAVEDVLPALVVGFDPVELAFDVVLGVVLGVVFGFVFEVVVTFEVALGFVVVGCLVVLFEPGFVAFLLVAGFFFVVVLGLTTFLLVFAAAMRGSKAPTTGLSLPDS